MRGSRSLLPNRSFDTDTQRHCAARREQVSIRLAAQCHCVPVNADVSPHDQYPDRRTTAEDLFHLRRELPSVGVQLRWAGQPVVLPAL